MRAHLCRQLETSRTVAHHGLPLVGRGPPTLTNPRSNHVGPRIGASLPDLFPVVDSHVLGDRFVNLKDSTSENFEGDAELREVALQCLEAFVTRCPKDVSSFIPRIIELGLIFIKHDPNYAEDSDGDGDVMDDDDDDFGWGDDFDDGEIDGMENEDSDGAASEESTTT